MAVQKKRVSISRRRNRHSATRVKLPHTVLCTCGAWKLNHNLCDSCGMYKGMQIIKK
ncbi:MAG: 50S ribosomal protein L32 [Alphaproteobacteria bacterium]|nr:MAG: 50S ribosomal protein L32 [Alphaproteobacteria bacterium]